MLTQADIKAIIGLIKHSDKYVVSDSPAVAMAAVFPDYVEEPNEEPLET